MHRPGTSLAAGSLSPDGKTVLILYAGRLTVRPTQSFEEKEILPAKTVAMVIGGNWAVSSPDGKWIYYPQTTDRPSILEAWRVDTASRKKERVITVLSPSWMASPVPSPDGKSIAFFQVKTLMLADANGRNERPLWDGTGFGGEFGGWPLVWSPDSSQILVPTLPHHLSLITVATGQIRPLPGWDDPIVSAVWPQWSSGPFLCVKHGHPVSMDLRSVPNCQIWHLSLPDGLRMPVTDASQGYLRIFGMGPEGHSLGHSLIVERTPPPPDWWDSFMMFLWQTSARHIPDFQPTVMLTLRN